MLSTCYIRLGGLLNKTDTFPAFWGSQSREEADRKHTRLNECTNHDKYCGDNKCVLRQKIPGLLLKGGTSGKTYLGTVYLS